MRARMMRRLLLVCWLVILAIGSPSVSTATSSCINPCAGEDPLRYVCTLWQYQNCGFNDMCIAQERIPIDTCNDLCYSNTEVYPTSPCLLTECGVLNCGNPI